MSILYYHCPAGISGDMNLGALVDLGVPVEGLRQGLDALQLPDWEIDIVRDQRRGISGTRVSVSCSESHPHRTFSDIRAIISAAALSDRVKELSLAIFRRLAEAEGAIHDKPPEAVHFHEVGAVDSIIDIVGAAICLEQLGFPRVVASTIELGGGTVQCRHGAMPVPAPATAELLKGVPTGIGGVPDEATTPTGAAILAVTADAFSDRQQFVTRRIGYGLGTRNPPHPNLLRVFLADPSDATGIALEPLHLLETTLDDMDPESYDFLLERLFDAGALDAFLTSVIMKKSRPGTNVTVLAPAECVAALRDTLFVHSTTLGVREQALQRSALRRETVSVTCRYGTVRVKRAYLGDRLVRAKPEYDDCRSLAERHAVALAEVRRAVAEACNG